MRTLTREQYDGRLDQIADRHGDSPTPAQSAQINRDLAAFKAIHQVAEARRPAATRPAQEPHNAAAGVIAEAVATALASRDAARQARDRAVRAQAEALARERIAAGRRIAEAVADPPSLSRADLGLATVAGMLAERAQPAHAARPVLEVTADPRAMSLADLRLAALAGMQGTSAFFTGQPASAAATPSPFMKGLVTSA